MAGHLWTSIFCQREAGMWLQERKRELAQASFERRRPEEQQAARIADVRLLMDL